MVTLCISWYPFQIENRAYTPGPGQPLRVQGPQPEPHEPQPEPHDEGCGTSELLQIEECGNEPQPEPPEPP